MADILASPTERRLARTLAGLRHELEVVKAGQRASQLDHSSLLYPLIVRDPVTGDVVGSVGQQDDGGVAVIPVGGPAPPVPQDPYGTPVMHGVMVGWNGEFVAGAPRPSNFAFVAVHASGAGANFVTDPSNIVGTLTGAGELPVVPFTGPVWFRLVAYSTSTPPVTSEASGTVSATPLQVVAQAVLDGIVGELALADRSVASVKVKLNAITADVIAGLAVGSPHLTANAVTAGKIDANAVTAREVVALSIGASEIAAGAIVADKLAANSVTAGAIAASAVTAGSIAANAVTAGAINAGAVTATKLAAEIAIASRFIAGNPTGNRAEMNDGGFEAWSGSLQTFDVNSATGAVMMLGAYKTANAGTRIELGGANGADVIRLYQGNVYGEIFADPAPGGTAGVFMAGSGSNRGKVVAYPGESAVSWTDGTRSRAAASAIADSLLIWGGNVNIEAQDQWGGGVTSVTYRNSSGSLVNSRTLEFVGAGSGEPALYSPFYDTQIVWSSGGLIIQNRAGTVGKQIVASNVGASSAATKKNIETITVPGGRTFMDLIQLIEPKAWNYLDEHVDGEPDPPALTYTVPGEILRDEAGRALFDPITREPRRGPDRTVTAEQPIPARRHWGLIAEELAQYLPGLVQPLPPGMGGMGLADRDMIALLWLAVRQIARLLVNRGMAPAPKG